MRIGSLFSGIGGLELGLEWAGVGETIWQCESDPFARTVLAAHWPNVPCFEDVRAIDETAPRADLICGGFPCQDISLAGKGAGIDGERSGLWTEFARIIRVLRPRFVFVENVAALTSRGLDRVLADLATIGFDAEWTVLGACCVGAPHRRERLFLLARDADREGESALAEHGKASRLPNVAADPSGITTRQSGGISGTCGASEAEPADDGEAGDVADTHSPRWEGHGTPFGSDPPHPEPLISGRWLIEPDVGRVANGIPHRVDWLRCLGNAVVPAQAAKAWEILSERIRQ